MTVPSRPVLCCEFGSGSVSQRYGSAKPDPDSHQNVTNPLHCSRHWYLEAFVVVFLYGAESLVEERLAERVEARAENAAARDLVIRQILEDVLQRHVRHSLQAHCRHSQL